MRSLTGSLPTPSAGPTVTKTVTARPAPPDDVAALRSAAAGLREVATELRHRAAQLTTLIPSSWHGAAASAAAATAHRLAAAMVITARVLDDDAAAIDVYAAAVALARRHHHHWLTVLGEVAGVVAVTALVVTATVATGGAAPALLAGATMAEEGGAAAAGVTAEVTAGSAVAGMGAAAASASSAEAALIESLSARVLALVPKLATLTRAQLVGAETFTGVETAVQTVASGHLDLGAIPVEFASNVALGAGAAGLAGRLEAAGLAGRLTGPLAMLLRGGSAERTPGIVAACARHLGGAATMSGVTGGEEEITTGRINMGDVVVSAAEGGVGSVAGDAASAAEAQVSRALTVVRHRSIPLIQTGADGAVTGPVTLGGVHRIDPNALRFSQKSLNRVGLRRDALAGGWRGDPLDVVVMSDGKLTSLDNRRIQVSRDGGIQPLVLVHPGDELLPPELVNSPRLADYGLTGGSTWKDLIDARLRRQDGWGKRNPMGSLLMPPKVSEGTLRVVGIRGPRLVNRAQ